MEPKQLSEELRKGQNPDFSRRRLIVGLSMLGATMAEAVSMYQVGIISRSRRQRSGDAESVFANLDGSKNLI